MNYIGSKIKLLPFIEDSINKVVDNNCKVFCDLFSGTGSVGAHLRKKVLRSLPMIYNIMHMYSIDNS